MNSEEWKLAAILFTDMLGYSSLSQRDHKLVLYGSLQKIANAVHVHVQLIKADADEHLWAENYNRRLDDVFGEEGEVATIAKQLNIKLGASEKEQVAANLTNNAPADDGSLRGRIFFENPDLLLTDLHNAVESDPLRGHPWFEKLCRKK